MCIRDRLDGPDAVAAAAHRAGVGLVEADGLTVAGSHDEHIICLLYTSGRPDAYVGVIHRLDTGVSGLMVYAKTPQAAAALSRQVTQSQQVYAEQDGRAEPDAGTPAAPPFVKQYRALIAGCLLYTSRCV